jgi:hypothetical protein
VSLQRHGDRLTRSANWLMFRAWPRVQRWLRVLHRVALFVALVLSLLAVLMTICQHGLGDRARDVGAEPWTTRVWAADRAGGITIRATTGRPVPDHRQSRPLGRLLPTVLVLLVVLALAGTGMMILVLRDGPILPGWIGALAVCPPAAARPARSAMIQRQRGADVSRRPPLPAAPVLLLSQGRVGEGGTNQAQPLGARYSGTGSERPLRRPVQR